ncbi:MAG: hypothetical protein GX130_03455 [Candidatus Hydrogenedens sp.]|nr:hypothetical protein [Candidatus Hydrogenedens sp.]
MKKNLKLEDVNITLGTVFLHSTLIILAVCLTFTYLEITDRRYSEINSILARLKKDMKVEEVISLFLEIPHVSFREKRIDTDSEEKNTEPLRFIWPYFDFPPGTLEITFEEDVIRSIAWWDASARGRVVYKERPVEKFKESFRYRTYLRWLITGNFWGIFYFLEAVATMLRIGVNIKRKRNNIWLYPMLVIWLLGSCIFYPRILMEWIYLL